MTFVQAQDGAMHIVLWPSSMASCETYPVYSRGVLPQIPVEKKDAATGMKLTDVVKELCVHP